MSNLYSVPLQNAVQRSLGNTLNQGETATITFSTSVSGVLQASASMPGLLVIDRVDANGTPTPSLTEYISFTGVSGSTVTGLTRGLAGTSDIAHSVGSIVEFVPDVTWANAINDTFTDQHNADGTHKITAFSGINAPEGFLINGRINVTSGASLSLSLSLQTLNGSNPTTTNPIYVRIDNTIRTITAPLSYTIGAGTNWTDSGSATMASNEIDYFVYLFYNSNASAMQIGFSRIPYARRRSDFDTTSADNDKSVLTGTWTSDDTVSVIGRFPARLSATPSFTWTIPTLTATNLIQRPIYETRELNWSPQYTGFSTAPSGVTAKYKVRDDFVRTNIYEANNGTSNSTSKSISFPFRSRNSVTYGAIINTIDNGTQGYGKFLFTGGSNTPSVFPSLTAPNWTASGNCRIETLGVTIEYGI